ncbi:MAG: hypothetical protein A2542_02460 [Parcubacteria group bacterium RIFOXYD2_FULL_52_8]|nr:MAG: hypothetical protein A2542_02460 [Parcubacteria group bacterium RIFOXYD2_FULL_52_8]
MTRFLIPLLLFVIAMGIFFGFTRDTIDQIGIAQAKITELDQALANDKDLRKIRTEKLEVYNSFSNADLDRINKLIPDSIDNVRLIIDIDNLAAKYGMVVKNARIKTDGMTPEVVGNNGKKYGSVILNFSVTGGYNELKLFLHDLQTSLRLVDVTGLAFIASDKDSNEYSFEVRTYWLK